MFDRIVIAGVRPRTPAPEHPAKATQAEPLDVSAEILADGHDVLAARACLVPLGACGAGGPVAPIVPAYDSGAWAPMRDEGNDRWAGSVLPRELGPATLVIDAWRDTWATWRRRVLVLADAGVVPAVEWEEGARILERQAGRKAVRPDGPRLLRRLASVLRRPGLADPERLEASADAVIGQLMDGPGSKSEVTRSASRMVWVDRARAGFSAWYELFPRSFGGLRGVAEHLPVIAAMGFDVVYLPPIHPIGRTARKGRGGVLDAGPTDPGSPWAIGSPAGGHEAIEPGLGTVEDFNALVDRARSLGMEIALDYALQCSPDHPWVERHPEWFGHRADGSIAFAENPPKKYQDIVPINFWPERKSDRVALWEACRGVLELWISRGVRTFRVDNPHTKPFAFWQWLIDRTRRDHPDVVLLAEAFTRPKIMAELAEVGFQQSYTYFTWRTTSQELAEYGTEVTAGPSSDYMRPSFWPNTPDILSGPLRRGPRSAFEARLVLAATMVPCWGMYSGFELLENQPASEDNEEYADSEKYTLKHRDWTSERSLAPLITRVNGTRHRHRALQRLRGFAVAHSDNPAIFAFSRRSAEGDDVVLVAVNLDPWRTQETTLWLDLGSLGLPWDQPYTAHDELSDRVFTWWGPSPYIRLDPAIAAAHLFHLSRG